MSETARTVMTSSTGKGPGSQMLVNKMFELEEAYRELNDKNKQIEGMRSRGRSTVAIGVNMTDKDKEITKLSYTVARLEEKLKLASVGLEGVKKEVRNEKEERTMIVRKLTETDKENKAMKAKLSSMRIKLGVASANYNVGKYDSEQLRTNYQEAQIQIARLEERLTAATTDLDKRREQTTPQAPGASVESRYQIDKDKKDLKKLRAEHNKLTEQRKEEFERVQDQEEKLQDLEFQHSMMRERIAGLENHLQMAELTLAREIGLREEVEQQNEVMMKEKEDFDSHLKSYKVKLSMSQAGQNVSRKQKEKIKKKDDEFKETIAELQKKLKVANSEIERLRARTVMTGKTVASVQGHTLRYRNVRKISGENVVKLERLPAPSTTQSSPGAGSADRLSNAGGSRNASNQSSPTADKLPSVDSSRTSFSKAPGTS